MTLERREITGNRTEITESAWSQTKLQRKPVAAVITKMISRLAVLVARHWYYDKRPMATLQLHPQLTGTRNLKFQASASGCERLPRHQLAQIPAAGTLNRSTEPSLVGVDDADIWRTNPRTWQKHVHPNNVLQSNRHIWPARYNCPSLGPFYQVNHTGQKSTVQKSTLPSYRHTVERKQNGRRANQ